jgi:hypothetical protein
VVAFQESLAELFEMLIAEEEGETAANEAWATKPLRLELQLPVFQIEGANHPVPV